MTSTETQLASSTSSLSASRDGPSIAQIYKEASELYLTRRIADSLETLQPLLHPRDGSAPIATASRGARIKVWSLYISILNEVVEMGQAEGKTAFGTAAKWKQLASKARDGSIWQDVVDIGYGGAESSVDADVVTNLATLLLTQAQSQKLTQQRLEAYLAASGTPSFDIASAMERPKPARSNTNGTSTPRDLNSRLKIIEIYALHVLPRNEEWDYAREFISMSEVMDDERKEAFLHALQNLQDENSIESKREAELQRQREQQADDARRREAETQAAEKAKAEAEQKRRKQETARTAEKKASKDSASSGAKPSASAVSSKPNSSPHTRKAGQPDRAASKKAKAVPPTVLGRASALMAALQRSLLSLGSTMRANPMPFIRLLAFIFALLLAFARRDVRDRVARMRSQSWDKVKATVGMGVKVSYV